MNLILNFIFAENPELAEYGAIQLLPELSSQPPTKARHVSNVGVKTGRVSREEVLAGFVRDVDETRVDDGIEAYLAECSHYRTTPTPIIFAVVGTGTRKIERYIVFITQEARYVFTHFRNAVFCVFSAYWGLHAPYNPNSEYILYILQRVVFDMITEFDDITPTCDQVIFDLKLEYRAS